MQLATPLTRYLIKAGTRRVVVEGQMGCQYSPVSLKKAYVSQMPRAELAVIADSRHATPVDQPERFNQTLEAFLSPHR